MSFMKIIGDIYFAKADSNDDPFKIHNIGDDVETNRKLQVVNMNNINDFKGLCVHRDNVTIDLDNPTSGYSFQVHGKSLFDNDIELSSGDIILSSGTIEVSDTLVIKNNTNTILSASSNGLILPVLTSEASNPDQGVVIFNSTSGKFRGYTGPSQGWVDLH